MHRTRRAGPVLAVVALFVTGPDDGVNIGAALLASASIVGLCGSMVTGPLDDAVPTVVATVLLAGGIATFVASSALFALPRDRHR